MFEANIVPGQGFQPFTIYESTDGISGTGRPVEGAIQATEKKLYGVLANATQKEKDQWKQNGHPITHKIIEYSAQVKANATDYLLTEDNREFYVQGRKNPGDMNIAMIYYVEERQDIKKRTE